jgi:hypothetical protein
MEQQLKDWLEGQNMTLSAFAALAGVSPKRPNDWAAQRISARMVARIEALTGGCVTALSFFPEEKSAAIPPGSAVANKISNPKKRAKKPDE